MTIGLWIAAILIFGLGGLTILLCLGGFVWGVIDAVKERKRIKREIAEGIRPKKQEKKPSNW